MLGLMVLGILIALVLKDLVDTTFFFVSLTMSLGLLVLAIWIYPKLNRLSVNLSILFCLIGVLIPSITIGISKVKSRLLELLMLLHTKRCRFYRWMLFQRNFQRLL